MRAGRSSARILRRLGAVVLAIVWTVSVGVSSQANPSRSLPHVTAANAQGVRGPFVSTPSRSSDIQIDLRKAPRIAPWRPGQPTIEVPRREDQTAVAPGRAASEAVGPIATAPQSVSPSEFSNANPNKNGIADTGFVPPDTNGDVGPNYFIQTVNVSFAIYDKQLSSPPLAGPSSINTIWNGFGGLCETQNRGDPIVLYDHLADRWLISQFAFNTDSANKAIAPYFECIAISQTSNPVNGGWHRYAFRMVDENNNDFFPDYPKLGVWPDGYYMSTQRGFPNGGLDVFAFDRANMLNGNPATFQRFFVSQPSLILLPSDLDGPPPPPGTPNSFWRAVDGDLWGGSDRVEEFQFHVDWGTPANSTFTGPTALAVDAFSADCAGGSGLRQDCVTQPGTTQKLDANSQWTMYRAQYRNFGSYETVVFNHTVDADGNDHAGIRWYELRRTAGTWSVNQQATYAPDGGAAGLADDPHRWMGSIAMDKAGDMALGYSASVDSPDDTRDVSPGIRYAGRMADDPADELPQGEFTLVDGTGNQTNRCTAPGATPCGDRWGDYSSMSVDPVDQCTFWYTQQYLVANNQWSTRIGAFRFPTCNKADLSITKTDHPDPVTAGSELFYDVTVTNNGPDTAFGVVVTDTLPAGVDFITSTPGCTLGGGNTLTCSLGDMPAGTSKNIEIKVAIPSDFVVNTGPRTITNTATVTSRWTDPNPTNNTATEATIVEDSADLAVTKICKPDGPLPAGGTGTCTIYVDNKGPSDARSVSLTDALTASGSFTITGVTPSQGTCTVSGNTVTCALGNLAAGGRATLTVDVTANEAVDINDVATVSAVTPDPDTSNNHATGSISVSAVADVAITKTDSPDPLNNGTVLTYTMNVSNAGPSTARNVVAADTVPAGMSILSVSAAGGTCNAGVPGDPFQPTTCTFGSLAPGGSTVMTVVVNVNPGRLNLAHNDATVSSDTFDPNNANNLASQDTTIAVLDLEITKSSDFDIYKPSSTVKYVVTVANHGPADAAGVVVTDNLPPGKQAVYLSDTGGCTKSGLVLTCNLGAIQGGAAKTFFVYVKIKGSQGTVSNTASVTSSVFDWQTSNNSSTRTILIKGGV